MPITHPRQVFENGEDGVSPGDDSTPKVPYVVFQISTQEVLNSNATYPRSDGMEVQGGDPDLVYLLKRTPFPVPDYDSRMRSLVVDQTADADNGFWDVTYTTQKRPKPDRVLAVENEEQDQFYQHLPIERIAIETALMAGLIYHFAVDGQTIPPKWRTRMDAFKNKVQNKILPNIDVAKQMIDDIEDNDGEPDIDGAPWEAPDA